MPYDGILKFKLNKFACKFKPKKYLHKRKRN